MTDQARRAAPPTAESPGAPERPALKRTLSLPLVVLYGLGVTIGAGIYVLIGAAAGRAGLYAPMAFVVSSVVMALTAASFAEMVSRLPVSAGEAAYVRAGFGSAKLSLLVGLLVVTSGIVSSAVITIGAAGYIRALADWPELLLIPLLLLAMGAVAAWGILQSVALAGLLTVIEAGGLVVVIAAAVADRPAVVTELAAVVPDLGDAAAWTAVVGTTLLAFFAFIGFEDMVNIAEEVVRPRRTMPWAIFLTLAIATVLYFAVTGVAVLAVPPAELAQSSAPLGLVFERVTGASPVAITAIAIVATLNGVIVQLIMAARVLYGLGCQGSLPAVLARVHPVTRTPLVATAVVVGIATALAMSFPLEGLAEMTSRVVLVVFALVNLALLRLKLRGDAAPDGAFAVWTWVPAAGFLSCLALLVGAAVG